MSEGNLLSEEITQRLLHEISEGCYANCRKLPPELTLAKEMGVSRTLIRDCLSALEREGFISRKHGVGTIVNPHILNATTRMDLEKEFLEMVSDAGYVPDMKIERIDKIPAEKEVAAKLHIEEGDLVLISERLVTADGRPAIYCMDYIAEANAKEGYDIKLLKEPVFKFIEQCCEQEIYMDLTEIRAVAAGEDLAEILNVDRQAPLLYMDEIGYSFMREPLLYSREYYVDGILSHKVLRKKI